MQTRTTIMKVFGNKRALLLLNSIGSTYDLDGLLGDQTWIMTICLAYSTHGGLYWSAWSLPGLPYLKEPGINWYNAWRNNCWYPGHQTSGPTVDRTIRKVVNGRFTLDVIPDIEWLGILPRSRSEKGWHLQARTGRGRYHLSGFWQFDNVFVASIPYSFDSTISTNAHQAVKRGFLLIIFIAPDLQ